MPPLQPANCGFIVAWSDVFRDRFEGQPLKGTEFRFGHQAIRGEATITRTGVEGSAIYALSAELREAISETGEADSVDRAAARSQHKRSDQTIVSAQRGKQSLSNFLRKAANLSPVAIGSVAGSGDCLRRDAGVIAAGKTRRTDQCHARKLIGVAPIARAISTAGGIAFDELDENYMLRKLPGVFAAGEMLDWEAPTGGYLLQASFATGAAAGRGVLRWLKR